MKFGIKEGDCFLWKDVEGMADDCLLRIKQVDGGRVDTEYPDPERQPSWAQPEDGEPYVGLLWMDQIRGMLRSGELVRCEKWDDPEDALEDEPRELEFYGQR